MDKVFNLNYLTEVDQITVDLKDDWVVFDFLYNLNFTRIKSIYKYTSEHQFQIEKNKHFLNWFDKNLNIEDRYQYYLNDVLWNNQVLASVKRRSYIVEDTVKHMNMEYDLDVDISCNMNTGEINEKTATNWCLLRPVVSDYNGYHLTIQNTIYRKHIHTTYIQLILKFLLENKISTFEFHYLDHIDN